MTFKYYCCILKGRQLSIGEVGLLPASEVLHAICDAGFQNNGLFDFEYVKPPKDGMYLMKVTRKADQQALLVFIDTRTHTKYIWLESRGDDDLTRQVVTAIEDALKPKAYDYGWDASVCKYVPNNLDDADFFFNAKAYVNEYLENKVASFYTYVIDVDRVQEIMAVLRQKLENKHKAKLIMKVIRAAYDADLTERPDFEPTVTEFKKQGQLCRASFNRYMTKPNPLADDDDYLKYLKEFRKLKNMA